MATVRRSSTSSTASLSRTKVVSGGPGTPGSAETLAESQLPTAGGIKTYVLDTSVLLSDPRAMLRFSEHEVVLPVVVVTELEAKRHHPELGFFARQALQLQGLSGEEAQLRVVTLRLELGHHDDREHHLVLAEAQHRSRVGQQDRGIEHIRLDATSCWELRFSQCLSAAWGSRSSADYFGAAEAGGGAGRRTTNRGHCDSPAHSTFGCATTRGRGARTEPPSDGGADTGPPSGAEIAPCGGPPERTTGALRHC